MELQEVAEVNDNDTATDEKIAELLSNDINGNDIERAVPQTESASSVPKKRQLFTWKTLDFILNDLLVVTFSIVDIFLDLAVCQQFYANDQMEFFYMSVLIFFFAQFSYCFLFVATWGKHLTPTKKVLVFICTLPVGQLIPFFTWIETFRITWLDNALTDLGLQPTACGGAARDMEREEDEQHAGSDMLWGYIQTKYQAHAGFLAEALAEAIPQCILQTIAIISTGDPSTLFIVSITISICVISSKGYLISYSIHRPTFIFNFLCIAADCFGLFATCSWLFNQNGGIADSFTSDSFQLPEDNLEAAWLVLFLTGCFLLVLGGLCLVVFSMMDDHLKTFNENMWGHYELDHVAFDLYIVRILAWVVAVIPVCVVFLTSKLTLIPVCLFNSLDPEHAQHYHFYSSLFKFLTLFKTDMRIAETNKFVLQCRQKVPQLSRAMKQHSIEWDYGRRRTPSERREQELSALRRWLDDVGKVEEQHVSRPTSVTVENTDENDDMVLQEAIARALAESFDDTAARAAVRSAHVNHAMQSRFGRMKRELSKRSAIFYELFTETGRTTTTTLTKKILFYVGMLFMWIGLVSTAILVPCFLLSTVLGVLFPIIQLLRGLIVANGSITFVSFFLTVAYSILIFALLCMIPLVGEFQLFRTDVVDLTGFPPIFYEIDTIRELHRRFELEIDDRLLEKTLDTFFGMDVALVIKSFLEPGGLIITEDTLKAFQHRVQSV
eukprot:CAMPEP_0114422778 /NCGR_PEP_ID=MMETSP0103-20121206/5792_1 /TAXON_ID=37642 ORGANISM="Paraphysomonas imperforata, Strain PA2" /NCGR_SAMPLE_ID=MMETSP0103 /ASSEMBLY_ACC=CAM_ASM_000201 /LENGTH=722 /DNA_ID=CAMNT_0001591387 /DNA_START=161 /DNA_END=2329 /DNA_ORIENTATION=+